MTRAPHTVGFWCAMCVWLGLLAPAHPQPSSSSSSSPPPAERRVVLIGDSITAGYGLDPSEAYPALLQARLRGQKLPFAIVNAGLSGDTTSGGLRRLEWILKQPADVLVVALGGNDGLRGIAPSLTRSNLCAMADKARARNPSMRIVLAGMQMPPSMGEEYAQAYRDLFPDVARSKGLVLIPFLLEGVGGRPEMNQPDLIHPTAEGQRRIFENVWAVLEPLLVELSKAP